MSDMEANDEIAMTDLDNKVLKHVLNSVVLSSLCLLSSCITCM